MTVPWNGLSRKLSKLHGIDSKFLLDMSACLAHIFGFCSRFFYPTRDDNDGVSPCSSLYGLHSGNCRDPSDGRENDRLKPAATV
jgi:hypothetical protein